MEQARCPCCRDFFNVNELIKPYRCNIHGICEPCLDNWSGSCPLCRSLPTRSVGYYQDGETIRVERWRNADGKLHREFLPAFISYFQDGGINVQIWYKNGKRDRVHGPAAVNYWQNGNTRIQNWIVNGKFHRDHGPASIEYYEEGLIKNKVWFEENGKSYRSLNYYPTGELHMDSWVKDDIMHRDGNNPALTEYFKDGKVHFQCWIYEGDEQRKVFYYEDGSTAEKMSEGGLQRWGRNGVNEKGKLIKGYYYAKGGWLMRKSPRLNREFSNSPSSLSLLSHRLTDDGDV